LQSTRTSHHPFLGHGFDIIKSNYLAAIKIFVDNLSPEILSLWHRAKQPNIDPSSCHGIQGA
jgi:hypothetical protein